VSPVIFDEDAGLRHAKHKFPIQTLIPKRAVEAFDMPILPRTSRLDVKGLHLVLSQPPLQDAGNELAAIIAAHVGGCATLCNEPLHHFNEVMGSQCSRHMQGQAFPALFINHRQDAQLASVVCSVGHEVPTPHVVESFRSGRDGASGVAPPPGGDASIA